MLNRLAAIACLCALVSGCAATQPAPAATPAATPTVAPQAAPTPTSGAVAPERGTSTTQSTSSAPTAPTTTTTTTTTTRLVIDSSASRARYRAQEQLVGRNLPSEAVGTSQAVSGAITLAPDGSIVPEQSQISVDLRQLKSDESRRDNFIQGTTLQTRQYPTATFVPRAISGLPNPLPTSGAATFQLSGDLTVHGVTRPASWQVTAQFDEGGLSGAATTQVNISDFGMTPPKAGPVLSIQDAITLELEFQASPQA